MKPNPFAPLGSPGGGNLAYCTEHALASFCEVQLMDPIFFLAHIALPP